MNNAIVDVRNVSITIETFQGPLRVIRNQDISLQPGEILGIVGESGCGKSVLVNSLMGLLPYGKTKIKADKFMIDGHDCLEFTEDDWNELRGTTVAMVFQDPMTSLNPIMTIGEQMYEVIHRTNAYGEDYDEKAIAIDLLKKMGLSTPERRLSQYPHELSGGMRQRVCIAMAVAGRPKILICDEPTTALDVTIQAQIIDLLKSLQKEYNFTTIFITHDLGVVASIADKVAVMYAGEIVEFGKVEEIFYDPRHPYPWSLLSSLPQLSTSKGDLYSIPGTPPSLYSPVKGDAFALRSDYAMQIDFEEHPPVFNVSDTHWAKTWLLHEDAPKVNKPEIIDNLHEKISAKMGFTTIKD